jgi:hypothetical protein
MAADSSTPQFTYDDLLAINQAIANGARSVKMADREVVYDSNADLLLARGAIQAYLDAQNTGVVRRRQYRVITGKGF